MWAAREEARVVGRAPTLALIRQGQPCDYTDSVALSLKWDTGIKWAPRDQNARDYMSSDQYSSWHQWKWSLPQSQQKRQLTGLNGRHNVFQWRMIFFSLFAVSFCHQGCDLTVHSDWPKYVGNFEQSFPHQMHICHPMAPQSTKPQSFVAPKPQSFIHREGNGCSLSDWAGVENPTPKLLKPGHYALISFGFRSVCVCTLTHIIIYDATYQ